MNQIKRLRIKVEYLFNLTERKPNISDAHQQNDRCRQMSRASKQRG